MIKFVDIDGHTVKLEEWRVSAYLYDMGNPEGKYLLVPMDSVVPNLGPNIVIGIRCSVRPNYSWFQLWQKRRKGSKLLDGKVEFDFQGTRNSLDVNAKPVWLTLKHNETHVVEV